MSNPLELYLVFNPMLNGKSVYQTQAHEFYFNLKKNVLGGDSQKSFMFWGKVQVSDYDEDEISKDILRFTEVIEKNRSMGEETQLFITDYHHFWVAKVESVHRVISNKELTLPFYDNKKVALWFKVSDMDLVAAEFEETSCYLAQLYVDNALMKEKIDSIHPYIGGIQFPLIVQNKSLERFFDRTYIEDGLRVSRKNALIENPKACDNTSFQVKSFVLPPPVFSKLSNILKNEILTIETNLAQQEGGDLALCESILSSYLRILESIMSDTLGRVLQKNFGKELFISLDGRQFSEMKSDDNIPITDFKLNFSIKSFVDLFSKNSFFGSKVLKKLEGDYPGLTSYLREELVPYIISSELVDKRSLYQNKKRVCVQKQEAISIRNNILGVGCKGVINNLIDFCLYSKKESPLKRSA